MFFMSFLGYLGAMRESRCLLSTVSEQIECIACGLEVRTQKQSVSEQKITYRPGYQRFLGLPLLVKSNSFKSLKSFTYSKW